MPYNHWECKLCMAVYSDKKKDITGLVICSFKRLESGIKLI